LDNKVIYLPVAHGEGNFYTDLVALNNIEANGQVIFRYVDKNDRPTQTYPDNPNGSLNAIAGLCDPSGYILGLMPHPERFTEIFHYPNWRRSNLREPQGLAIFRNVVHYVKNS
jgi:phosphoribosylformylglycinamidine synthase